MAAAFARKIMPLCDSVNDDP